MTLQSKDHYEVISMFEREYAHKNLDKLAKSEWSNGTVYANELTNELFIAYRRGVAFGKVAF